MKKAAVSSKRMIITVVYSKHEHLVMLLPENVLPVTESVFFSKGTD